MKRILIVLIVCLLCFISGWWVNELWRFGNGMKDDKAEKKWLKRENPFYNNDSCRKQSISIVYYSPTVFTGGFSSITLRLNQTGKMFLIDSIAKLTTENEGGGVFEWKVDTSAFGIWCIKDNFVFCRFFSNKDFIERTFLSSENSKRGLEILDCPTVLVIPENTDTLLIRKTPCIVEKNN